MRLCWLQPTCAVHKSENISWSENLDLQLWWLFLNMFREVQVGTWKYNQNPGADKPFVCAQWKRSEFNFILFEKGGRFSWQAHKICVMVRVADTQSQGENHLHSVIILSGSSFKLSWASVPVPKLSLRRKKNYILTESTDLFMSYQHWEVFVRCFSKVGKTFCTSVLWSAVMIPFTYALPLSEVQETLTASWE